MQAISDEVARARPDLALTWRSGWDRARGRPVVLGISPTDRTWLSAVCDRILGSDWRARFHQDQELTEKV